MADPAHADYRIVHVETSPEQRAANLRRRAASDRNVAYWNENYCELTERYLHRFLVIYDGVVLRDFPDAISQNEFLNRLPREQARAAFHHYVDYADCFCTGFPRP